MSIYTRLTVAGSERRADVVVPSAEPVGAAIPRLLDLLGETAGTVARPLAILAPDGEQIDVALSPQQLDLVDGTLVRLVRLDAAPPPPVVIDVTDAAADAHDARPDRWDDRARSLAGGTGIAASFALAGLVAPWPSAGAAVASLLGILLLLLAGAAGLGLGGLQRVAACVGAAAAGLALPLGVLTTGTLLASGAAEAAILAGIAAALAAAFTTALLAVGVARRRRGAVAGGALGAVLASLLLGMLLAGVDVVPAAAIAGVVATFASGPLPWVALSAAGLTDLDQRAAEGRPPARERAFAAIDEAYAASRGASRPRHP